jgi:hypothetical protein
MRLDLGATVPQRHAREAARFHRRAAGQDGRMDIETLDYARLSEEAMAAADRASTLEECQAHLDRAMRFAQLACLERRRPGRSNVVAIATARRPVGCS